MLWVSARWAAYSRFPERSGMSIETTDLVQQWWIRPGDLPDVLYDPRFHSRAYIEAYLELTNASPEQAEAVRRRADELEQLARALGYALADDEFEIEA
jgi:hypothetical protein